MILLQPQPIVWRENQSPGTITQLTAKDNDGPENGAPFIFSISSDASFEIQTKFGINGLYYFNLCYYYYYYY